MDEEDDDGFWGQCHLRLVLRYQTETGTDSVELLNQLAEGWAPGTVCALRDVQAILIAMEELHGDGSYMENFGARRAECLHLGADGSTRIALNLSMDKFWPDIRIEVDRLLRTADAMSTNGGSHHEAN